MSNPFPYQEGPFANHDRHNPVVKTVRNNSGGIDYYQGGHKGLGDGLGHGHASLAGQARGLAPRPPVNDFLGNLANRGAGAYNPQLGPRW